MPIDVHGSLDRVKDVSSFVEARCCALSRSSAYAWRTLTTFPSCGYQRTPSCHQPDRPRRKRPAADARDGPIETHALPSPREGCRHPVDQGAFDRCEQGTCEDCSPLFSLRRLLAHAAHTLPPGWGQVLFMGIASAAAGGSTRAGASREQVTFTTRWMIHAWD